MNHKHKLILLLIGLIVQTIINSGCSRLYKNLSNNSPRTTSNQNNYISNNAKTNIDNDIGSQLVASARSIEKSLATLAAAQEINNIPVLNTAPLLTPEGGMGGTADIDWTGPLEPLLEKIASMADYNLKIMGSPPPLPIIVSITQSKAIIADILKNASLQAGKRVNIVAFPANKIIELRYRFGSIDSQSASNNTNNNDSGASQNQNKSSNHGKKNG